MKLFKKLFESKTVSRDEAIAEIAGSGTPPRHAPPSWDTQRIGDWFLFGALAALAAAAAMWFRSVPLGITLLGLLLMILVQGLRRIEADPPHKGVRTFLQKRTNRLVNEGWNFFFLTPFVRGVIPVNVTKFNQDILVKNVRTPDRAELEVPIGVTWSPSSSRTLVTSAEHADRQTLPLNNFIYSGRHRGVVDIFRDIVEERIREWLIASHEGPQTWEYALKSRRQAILVLLKAILGEEEEVKPISSSIPTPVLDRYFGGLPPTDKWEAEKYGKNWELLRERIKEDARAPHLNPGKLEEGKYEESLKQAIRERNEIADKLRRGNGNYPLRSLGIVIHRLNVGAIKVVGKVAEAAERGAQETQEREGEIVEIEHLIARMGELMAAPPEGPGFTAEQALEAFQTEREKVTKTVEERKITISPETRASLEKMNPVWAGIITALLAKKVLGEKPEAKPGGENA